jgi:IrrE N-terminal-like domain
VASFFARGEIDEGKLSSFNPLLRRKSIEWRWVDAGDRSAGSIRVVRRASNANEATQYRIHINRNHEPAVKFATLAHELGHLFLGHLGPDRKLDVPERRALGDSQRELEAESVAYIVCERNGMQSASQPYLSNFVNANTTVDQIDVYRVMRAAGQVETLIELADHTRYDPPARPHRR